MEKIKDPKKMDRGRRNIKLEGRSKKGKTLEKPNHGNSKFDYERVVIIINGFMDDCTKEQVCAMADIGTTTFDEWMKSSVEIAWDLHEPYEDVNEETGDKVIKYFKRKVQRTFPRLVRYAKSAPYIRMRRSILKSGESDWRAAESFLKRRDPLYKDKQENTEKQYRYVLGDNEKPSPFVKKKTNQEDGSGKK